MLGNLEDGVLVEGVPGLTIGMATGVTTPITTNSGGNPDQLDPTFVATPDDRYVFYDVNPPTVLAPRADPLALDATYVADTVAHTKTAVLTAFPGVTADLGELESVGANGELLAFDGTGNGLVAGANGVGHPYVQNVETKQTIILDAAPQTGADATSTPALPPVQSGDSPEIALSADGSIVAFSSDASNLAPGDLNGASNV